MKNKIGMGALCVLLVLFAAGVSGCKNDDEGDRWVSSMGAPKIGDIKSLTFEGVSPVVSTYNEAKSLVYDFLSDYMDSLNYWPGDSFNDVFEAKYGKEKNDWFEDQGQSYSYSVNINDTASIKKVFPTAVGTIKGSEKASWSHNRLTYKNSNSPELDGDKETSSNSTKRTISITSGYVEPDYYSDWKVAGIVKSEYSNKWEQTVQKKAEDKYTESYSQKSKTAGALLIDDGTRAAKIRFSTSWDQAGKTRSAVWVTSSNHAPVEVWNLEGTEILFTIPESEAGYY